MKTDAETIATIQTRATRHDDVRETLLLCSDVLSLAPTSQGRALHHALRAAQRSRQIKTVLREAALA